MYQLLSKRGLTFAFVGGLLLVVLYYIMVAMGLGEFNSLPEEDQPGSNLFNFGLYVAIILAGAAAIISVLFGLKQFFGRMAANPKAALMGMVGVVIAVIIFLVLYAMSSGAATSYEMRDVMDQFGISGGRSKFISAFLGTGVAMVLLCFVVLILSELRNIIK